MIFAPRKVIIKANFCNDLSKRTFLSENEVSFSLGESSFMIMTMY